MRPSRNRTNHATHILKNTGQKTMTNAHHMSTALQLHARNTTDTHERVMKEVLGYTHATHHMPFRSLNKLRKHVCAAMFQCATQMKKWQKNQGTRFFIGRVNP